MSGAAPQRSRVSIGLPVFNGERFLEETLDALLRQTYTDFELVIADNASTDRTKEICLAAAARDPRVRYAGSETNRGATWNFNRAFTLTTGEYFKWAAYDDLCKSEFVAQGVEALDRVPEAVLAYPRTRLIDEDGRTVRDHADALALPHTRPHERLAALVPALGYANPLYGVIRADALRQTRLVGAYASSDYVLLAELALLGRFVELPDRLFLRRIHPQMSRKVNPRAADVARWFSPEARPGYRAESWRLFGEHLRSIARAPLPPLERARCAAVFGAVGGRRYAHHLARELPALAVARVADSRLTGLRRVL